MRPQPTTRRQANNDVITSGQQQKKNLPMPLLQTQADGSTICSLLRLSGWPLHGWSWQRVLAAAAGNDRCVLRQLPVLQRLASVDNATRHHASNGSVHRPWPKDVTLSLSLWQGGGHPCSRPHAGRGTTLLTTVGRRPWRRLAFTAGAAVINLCHVWCGLSNSVLSVHQSRRLMSFLDCFI